MQRLRDRQRQRAQHAFGDQVVREAAVAQQLRLLQLAPGIDDVERVHLEHARGDVGIEVAAGDRGHAHQAQRRLRQPRQAALDQRAQRGRHGQPRGVQARRRIAEGEQGAQGLEREQRIAAAVRAQRRAPQGRLEARQRQRGEQRLDRGGVEHLELQHLERRAVGVAQQQRQRRGQLLAAHAEQPGDAPRAHRGGERQQRLERGLVGMVQVVDGDAFEAGLAPGLERRGERLLQPQGIEAAARRLAQLGREPRQLLHHPGLERRGEALLRPAHQPRQQRIGQARLAGLGAAGEHLRMRLERVLDQPRLADAGIAGDEQHAPLGERRLEPHALGVAADQPRRTQHRHRRRRRRAPGSAPRPRRSAWRVRWSRGPARRAARSSAARGSGRRRPARAPRSPRR